MMSTQLQNRNIILGVSGGIAAYKACALCRLLVTHGAKVKVVMTKAATQLVTPATFAALSGEKVHADLFDSPEEISHITLGAHADLLVIAPSTANTIAKLAAGLADDMLSATALAAACPIVVVPAMNTRMYHNAATQDNIATLIRRGIYVLKPAQGDLACGEEGEGRMPEPEDIFEFICALLGHPRLGYDGRTLLPPPTAPLEIGQTKLLPRAFGAGSKILITAGPTVEALDPVRFLSNRSSGKMGYALAAAARERGAEVVLISGPVAELTPPGVTRVDVKTAQEMLQAVESYLPGTQIVIGCAAVSDYRAAQISSEKISKGSEDELTLHLIKNPDIIAAVGRRESERPYTVGFAAETQFGPEHARLKLEQKHLDLIVLNDVSAEDSGIESDFNEVTVFDAQGEVAHLSKQSKRVIADQLIELIFRAAALYRKQG